MNRRCNVCARARAFCKYKQHMVVFICIIYFEGSGGWGAHANINKIIHSLALKFASKTQKSKK